MKGYPGAELSLRDSAPHDVSTGPLRVLLVPDWAHWVTGTIARAIARSNSWIAPAIISAHVLRTIQREEPRIFENFDLVHFICPHASREWIDALRARLPVVTSHHHVTDWAEVSHNAHGDAIVVGALEWARDLESRGIGADRIVVMRSGVDTILFRPRSPDVVKRTRAKLGFAGDGPLIGFFAKADSNDDDRKGTNVFAEAVDILRARIPDASVLIVGPGWSAMAEGFHRKGVQCAWIPFVSQYHDLAVLYSILDFYWVTSRVEGGPVTLHEAMSAGICCVTTPVGTALELVDDGINAIMVRKNDAAGVAGATETLWRDPQRRAAIGSRARQTAVAELDERMTSKRVSDAYRIALRTFSDRIGEESSRRVPNQFAMDVRSDSAEPTTLADRSPLPSKLTQRIAMLEKLVWGEHLMLEKGQRRVGLQLIVKAWKENPLSGEPPRRLLRNVLPGAVVRSLVRAKHAFG